MPDEAPVISTTGVPRLLQPPPRAWDYPCPSVIPNRNAPLPELSWPLRSPAHIRDKRPPLLHCGYANPACHETPHAGLTFRAGVPTFKKRANVRGHRR